MIRPASDNLSRTGSGDPDVDASDIAISAKGGAVTPAGTTVSFSNKCGTEAATMRAAGVVDLATDIAARLANGDARPNPVVSADGIQVLV
jgi:hypothetical protein